MINEGRRGFLRGFIAAAPVVILTPGLLMPVRSIVAPDPIFVESSITHLTKALRAMIDVTEVTEAMYEQDFDKAIAHHKVVAERIEFHMDEAFKLMYRNALA